MSTRAWDRVTRHSPFPPKYKRVPGEGPVPCPLMLIGERPGKNEALRGRPFIGDAGDVLNTVLAAANLDRKQIYITNLVKEFREYEKPTAEEMAAGLLDVRKELDEVQPAIVGLLGTYAVEALLERARAELERTHGVPVAKDGIVFVPMFHPAAGLYNPEAMNLVLDDFLTLAKLIDGEIAVREDKWAGKEKYTTLEYAKHSERWVKLDCAVDTEGDLEHPWCATVSVGAGLADLIKPGQKLRLDGGKVYLHNSLHDLGVLRRMDCEVGEEQFVDTMVLAYLLCVEPQGLKELAYRHCAMEMHSYMELVEEPSREKALEFMLKIAEGEWPDPEPYIVLEKGTPKVKKPWNMKRLAGRAIADIVEDKRDKDGNPPDLRERWKHWDDEVKRPVVDALGEMPVATLDDVEPEKAEWYACRDADATLRIAPVLEAKIKDMGLEEAARLDHSIIPMIDRMQEVGIKLAPKKFWDEMEAKCLDQMGRSKYTVFTMTGAAINPASGDQVAELLYGQMGLTPPRYTDSGSRGKVDAVALESLLSQAPVIQPLMDYTEANKIKGTYVYPLRKIAVSAKDGRAHATCRITRTTTGRLSMADPPLHQIPIVSELGREIRGGFVAADGCVFGDWDVDQLEMRMCAHDSKDVEMCRLFNEGRDIHAETTCKIFSVSMGSLSRDPKTGKVNDVRRTVAKHCGFGIINGITEHGLVNYLILNRCKRPDGESWTLDDCVGLLKEWYKIYKGVKRFQLDCIAEAQATGLTRETVSGRIMYLPAVWSPVKWVRETAMRNSYVMHTQGGGAALLKRSMTVMWKHIFKGRKMEADPLLWVHDEILAEIKDKKSVREEIDKAMVKALCETTKLRVPVKASGGFGPNWLEAH